MPVTDQIRDKLSQFAAQAGRVPDEGPLRSRDIMSARRVICANAFRNIFIPRGAWAGT